MLGVTHSLFKFIHNLYIAEIYTPRTIYLPLTVWVYFHLILHSEL